MAQNPSVISIGSHCLTATSLKNSGLRKFSGPFDWIFSSLDMVADCIEDDFATLLDKRYLQQIPPHLRNAPETDRCDHILFKDRYNIPSMFNHADPTEPDDYASLERCVGRFQKSLFNEPTVLVGMCEPRRASHQAFDRLRTLLSSNDNVRLAVAVNTQQDANIPKMEAVLDDGLHKLVNFQSTSAMNGVAFQEDADNSFLSAWITDCLH